MTDHASIHKPKRKLLLALLWDCGWHRHGALRRVGGVRYSARLLELKRLGYQIEDEPLAGEPGKRYRLTTRKLGEPLGKRVKVYLRERDCVRLLERGEVSLHLENCVAKALRSFQHNKDNL